MTWGRLAIGLIAFGAWAQTPAQQVAAVLDDWHQAASVADEARYFGHFAPNGIFMGTDATEHVPPSGKSGHYQTLGTGEGSDASKLETGGGGIKKFL